LFQSAGGYEIGPRTNERGRIAGKVSRKAADLLNCANESVLKVFFGLGSGFFFFWLLVLEIVSHWLCWNMAYVGRILVIWWFWCMCHVEGLSSCEAPQQMLAALLSGHDHDGNSAPAVQTPSPQRVL
jgi:hypothetical protein